jgi:hypothetical protein
LDIGPPLLSVVVACEAYFNANDDCVMKPHRVELGVMTKALLLLLASQNFSR